MLCSMLLHRSFIRGQLGLSLDFPSLDVPQRPGPWPMGLIYGPSIFVGCISSRPTDDARFLGLQQSQFCAFLFAAPSAAIRFGTAVASLFRPRGRVLMGSRGKA
jgi:hypothetical protein